MGVGKGARSSTRFSPVWRMGAIAQPRQQLLELHMVGGAVVLRDEGASARGAPGAWAKKCRSTRSPSPRCRSSGRRSGGAPLPLRCGAGELRGTVAGSRKPPRPNRRNHPEPPALQTLPGIHPRRPPHPGPSGVRAVRQQSVLPRFPASRWRTPSPSLIAHRHLKHPQVAGPVGVRIELQPPVHLRVRLHRHDAAVRTQEPQHPEGVPSGVGPHVQEDRKPGRAPAPGAVPAPGGSQSCGK